MCGISGIYSSNGYDKSLLHDFRKILNHRGPDGDGVYANETIALFHNRLSIIDLSTSANQPFISKNKRYVMVYNGEVYNYNELANDIRSHYSPGEFNFSSTSDTEIILEAFTIWGIDFLKKLNGMFSIAIYDTETDSLYLFRDRLGIKPLYYSKTKEGIMFSSELKTFKKIKIQPYSINKNAIGLYLNMGYIPAPYTIYNEVNKLLAGEYLIYKDNQITKHKFWTPADQITSNLIVSEKMALVKLSELIKSSVQYQLISDVPVGVFLSGGIDSSLITALAVHQSSVKVNTFSIGFEENRYNESHYARKVANYLGTNHNEFILSYKNAIDLIEKFTDIYDEPFADSSGIPTMLVSGLARDYVKVCLSGEGGDELFLGYGSYIWSKRLNNPIISRNKKLISNLLKLSKKNKFKRAIGYFEFNKDSFLPAHIHAAEQNFFSAFEVCQITGSEINYEFMAERLSQHSLDRKLSAMEQQAFFDINFYLPGDLLTKVDRASMAYSLETRVPYLDHRIVETALNIHPSLKYKNGVSKYILKQILYQYIPKEFFNRPKQGFAIPLENWLKNELKEFLMDNLSIEKMKAKGYIQDIEYVEKLKNDFFNGDSFLYNRLWTLALLHKWES